MDLCRGFLWGDARVAQMGFRDAFLSVGSDKDRTCPSDLYSEIRIATSPLLLEVAVDLAHETQSRTVCREKAHGD